MATQAEILAADDRYVMHTYKRLPGAFIRGEGCHIWDAAGRQYLDFLAGIAVCQLGHCHPAIVDALTKQAKTLIHTSNYMANEPEAFLAKRLCEISGMDKVFYTNCGTTAAETAIKIAKKHGLRKRPSGDYEIITLHRSFHGRSLGSLTATAQAKYQDPFRPLVPGFVHVAANDLSELKSAFGPKTAAVMIEPVQGEGGVTPMTSEFLHGAKSLCAEHDALFILDEVQTGIGRTGKWFAFQHHGIEPDVLCVAKALGGGVPIGACLAKGAAAEILVAGDHGSTFGGNPLACAVALAVLETIEKEGLIEHCSRMGEYVRSKFRAMGSPVKEVRGLGLMNGVVLDQPIAREVVGKCLEMGLVTNATDEHTLRLVPPIIVTESQIDEAVGVFEKAFASLVPAGASR